MSIEERLEQVIGDLNLNKKKFAESIQVSSGNLSDWLNKDKRSKPSLEALSRICDAHNVNLNWLLTGKGEQYLNSKKNKIEELKKIVRGIEAKTKKSDAGKLEEMDVVGEIAAGEPLEVDNSESLFRIGVPYGLLDNDPNEYFVFRVNGKSMEPLIQHQDLAFIRKCSEWKALDGRICAIRIEGEITLKKMRLDQRHKIVVFKALNPNYDDILLKPEEVRDLKLIGYLALQIRSHK